MSLHDIRDAVINIYRERKFLAATLRDTRTVVGRLELIIGVVVHLVFIFFYLLIFRVRRSPSVCSLCGISAHLIAACCPSIHVITYSMDQPANRSPLLRLFHCSICTQIKLMPSLSVLCMQRWLCLSDAPSRECLVRCR